MARIIDLTQMMSGPYANMILGDLGHDVIKVEPFRAGDSIRRQPPFLNGVSVYFFAMNRNKRGVIIDLKNPAGKEVFLDLIRSADAVVDNFRPGVMDNLDLSYERLKQVNPGIIQVSVNGFGSFGSLRHKTAFDAVAQAMSGNMMLSAPDDGGEPLKSGIPMADLGAGMYAALGVVRALLERRTTGQGQQMEVSLLDATLSFSGHIGEQFLMADQIAAGLGRAVPDGLYATADGFLALAAYTDQAWTALCTALDRRDWLADPRLRSMADRYKVRTELEAGLQTALAGRPTAYWLAVLSQHGLSVAPVATEAAVSVNADLSARGMLPSIHHPITGALQTSGNPIRRLDSSAPAVYAPAPRHGQHTVSVLASLPGYSHDRIQELVAAGVVGDLIAES